LGGLFGPRLASIEPARSGLLTEISALHDSLCAQKRHQQPAAFAPLEDSVPYPKPLPIVLQPARYVKRKNRSELFLSTFDDFNERNSGATGRKPTGPRPWSPPTPPQASYQTAK